jgi:hypothetical protein
MKNLKLLLGRAVFVLGRSRGRAGARSKTDAASSIACFAIRRHNGVAGFPVASLMTPLKLTNGGTVQKPLTASAATK